MTLDSLQAQTETYKHITNRDLPKRYAVLLFVLFVCWTAGFVTEAWILLGAATFFEGLLYTLVKLPNRGVGDSAQRIVSYLVCCVTLSVLYFIPAVLLGSHGDPALYSFGILWTVIALSGTATMYHALPAYFWAVTLPGFVAGFYVLNASKGIEFETRDPQLFLFPLCIFMIFCVNTIRMLWDYRDTYKELESSRAESLARLRHVEYLNRHDGLTELLNRAAFDSELAELLDSAQAGQSVGVIIIDLNDFKPINDSLGHDAGDCVLKAVAQHISEVVGADGLTARLGGDEFAIALAGASEERLKDICGLISKRISEGVAHEGAHITFGASYGIAFSNASLNTVAKICAAADQAMYRCKADIEKPPTVYSEDLFPRRHSFAERKELQHAIKTGEIRPFYQPKVFTATGEVAGFEALSRWVHPTKGILYPGEFLDQAKEFNLLHDLTYSVVQNVLKDLTAWRRQGLDPGRISVNIPEATLATRSGTEEIQWLLAQIPGCEQFLTFEITEDVVLARSADLVRSSVQQFRDLGVYISLDDFGTGYASFQHIREIALDELKIDKSFVANLTEDRATDIIVAGFLSIAKGLELDVVAEGVETEAQLEKIAQLGCKYAQGYLFCRDVRPEVVPDLLAQDGRQLLRAT